MEGGEAQAASGKESDVHLPLLGPRESSGLSDRTWRQGWLEEKGSGGGGTPGWVGGRGELSPPPDKVLGFVTQKEAEVQSGVTG